MKRKISIILVIVFLFTIYGCNELSKTNNVDDLSNTEIQTFCDNIGSVNYSFPEEYQLKKHNEDDKSKVYSVEDSSLYIYIEVYYSNEINSDEELQKSFYSIINNASEKKFFDGKYYNNDYGCSATFQYENNIMNDEIYNVKGYVTFYNGYFVLVQVGNMGTNFNYSDLFDYVTTNITINNIKSDTGKKTALRSLTANYNKEVSTGIEIQEDQFSAETTSDTTSPTTNTVNTIESTESITDTQTDITSQSNENITNAASFTLDNYNKLSEGMTYDEVVTIIGKPTERMSYVESGDNTAACYSWSNSNGSNCVILFNNNIVYTKSIVWLG